MPTETPGRDMPWQISYSAMTKDRALAGRTLSFFISTYCSRYKPQQRSATSLLQNSFWIAFLASNIYSMIR
jgi:hypothetical protein